MPWLGTSVQYLCIRKQINTIAMKNTDYNLDTLASMISSEASFSALLDIMGDMGLELDSASTAA